MAFKMKPPYDINNTPIYRVDFKGEKILGKANRNGSIIVNKDLTPEEEEDNISHEMVHIEQMKRGDLYYDTHNVYWKGKKYPRSSMKEGGRNLPWEKEAYRRGKKKR